MNGKQCRCSPDQRPHSAESDLGLHHLFRPICSKTLGKYGYLIKEPPSEIFNPLLTLSILWTIPADDKLITFSYFPKKIGFNISCKLSPHETICMEHQSLFLGKNTKNISQCPLLIFFPSTLSQICPRSISMPNSPYNTVDFIKNISELIVSICRW